MAFNFSSMLALASLVLAFTRHATAVGAGAAALNEQAGYGGGAVTSGRVPILYEAYYPEPRAWNPRRSSLQEIERLRELTSQLLREEEQLEQMEQLAAASGPAENVLEPRGQLLRYVFSNGNEQTAPKPGPLVPVNPASSFGNAPADVQVASLTISDVGPQHKVRHHHGQANWLLRRLAAASAA